MTAHAPGTGRGTDLRGREDECAELDGAGVRSPSRREPVARLAGRGRHREDGAAAVPDRLRIGSDDRQGRGGGIGDGACRSPASISSAGPCSIVASGFRIRSVRRSRSCSASGPAPPPDRFLVGLAALSLLSEAAEERPLLCVVDDAQWVDHASALTLAFVSRRLLAEPVGIVFSAREPGDELRHLPELELRGLVNGDAQALLSSSLAFAPDERVRVRMIAETRGNPLALAGAGPGFDGFSARRRVRGPGGRGAARDVSRKDSCAGSRPCPRRRGSCSWSRPRSRSAIRSCFWRALERLGTTPAWEESETDGLLTIGEQRDVPSSPGALRDVPLGGSGGAPGGASGAGGGDGPGRRPRSPGVASGCGGFRARRGRRGRARALCGAGSGAGRHRGGGGVSAALRSR